MNEIILKDKSQGKEGHRMNMKKIATIAMAIAVFAGFNFACIPSTEAGFSIPKIGDIVKMPSSDAGGGNVNGGASPGATTTVAWTLKGKVVDGTAPIKDARIYVVQYTDGGSTPIWHTEGNKVVFENIRKGSAVAFSQEDGTFTSGGFRDIPRISVICYARGYGFTYRDLESRNYDNNTVFDLRGGARGSGTTMVSGIIK